MSEGERDSQPSSRHSEVVVAQGFVNGTKGDDNEVTSHVHGAADFQYSVRKKWQRT